MKQSYREPEQIEDVLLPDLDFVPGNAREEAIIEVLCKIPDLDYRRLVERFQQFSWFVPDIKDPIQFAIFDGHTDIQMTVGEWSSPPAKLAMVIYLSPSLEEVPADILRAGVADKLAHILLGHETIVTLEKDSETAQREERLRKLCQWGFDEGFLKYRHLVEEAD